MIAIRGGEFLWKVDVVIERRADLCFDECSIAVRGFFYVSIELG